MRTTQGLTQSEIARKAGIGIATLRKIENGTVVEPGYFTVLAIATALGAEPSLLPAAGSGAGPVSPKQNAGSIEERGSGVTGRDGGKNSDRPDLGTHS
jgi:transcriptional regulator with XRE-family HTH domain